MSFPRFETPVYVYADRIRVKQVIVNLLSNAIKYNRPGGSVGVQCAAGANHQVRVSVTDTGPGLAPEQVAQLFQPFNRLGRETGAEEGTGIGLVVTKRLVELMGGIIGIDSNVGVGSVFWFELPAASAPRLLAVAADGDGGVGSSDQPEQGAAPGPKRTLLYVEDNPANLELVEQLIARRSDLKLLTAIDGHLGLAVARLQRPDVILLDINLPGIGGFDLLKMLRDDPATASIPVMALSANAVPRDIANGLEAGFFRYLTKPIKIDEFTGALDLALEHAAEDQVASTQ